MANRGQITDEIKAKSKELLGYEIDQKELRLMPYVQCVMMNEQVIEPRKINEEGAVFCRSGAQTDTLKWVLQGFR